MAAGAVAAARADEPGRRGSHAVAHGGQPPPPAGVENGCRRASRIVDALASDFAQAQRRVDQRTRALDRTVGSADAVDRARHGALRRLGRFTGLDLVGQPPTTAQARRRAATSRPNLPGRRRARHLASVRALRRPRRQLFAARQPAAHTAHDGRAPHIADQHRPVPALGGLCAPVRLDRHARPDRPARSHARDDGRIAAPPWPLLELVRHRAQGCTVADVRVDGRQRQPQWSPARRRAGLHRARSRAVRHGRRTARDRGLAGAHRAAARSRSSGLARWRATTPARPARPDRRCGGSAGVARRPAAQCGR